MNATSLYVTTCRLILLADAADESTWTDLYRLFPYLGKSLSCTVCENLLMEPYTPTTDCQHHVCKKCIGGRQIIKPSCTRCRDCEDHIENLPLRTLLQCYKHLCEYFMDTDVYRKISNENGTAAGVGLLELIREGAEFNDDYKTTADLSTSAYNTLLCAYTDSALTQEQAGSSSSYSDSPNFIANANGSPETSQTLTFFKSKQSGDAKPSRKRSKRRVVSRTGCRCGQASATPNVSRCFGQRCPCYVEKIPCIKCVCKGCHNPRSRPDN